jgi:hypothetical protein
MVKPFLNQSFIHEFTVEGMVLFLLPVTRCTENERRIGEHSLDVTKSNTT